MASRALDHFKAYNDRHGHAQGDEALKLIGGALRRYARKPLVACHYGGEEFCVILPDTTAQAAALYSAKAAVRNLVAEFHGRRVDDPASIEAGSSGVSLSLSDDARRSGRG